jgi:hypothetical protein
MGLALFSGVFYTGGYSMEWHRRHRAGKLIQQLQRFQVDQTTEEQVKKLANEYGGKYFPPARATQNELAQPAHYDIEVSSPHVTIANSTYALPGSRSWTMVAVIDVGNGKLTTLLLEQVVNRSDGFVLDADVSLLHSSKYDGLHDLGPYNVHEGATGLPGEAFGVSLSPEATEEERQKAFDFNLSCLTQLRECRHVCEILPNAWRDLSPEHRLRYTDGREVVTDSECHERMK